MVKIGAQDIESKINGSRASTNAFNTNAFNTNAFNTNAQTLRDSPSS